MGSLLNEIKIPFQGKNGNLTVREKEILALQFNTIQSLNILEIL